jgi:hypothetical protein
MSTVAQMLWLIVLLTNKVVLFRMIDVYNEPLLANGIDAVLWCWRSIEMKKHGVQL